MAFGDCACKPAHYINPALSSNFFSFFSSFSLLTIALCLTCYMPTLQAYTMTYTATVILAKTGLTSQSRLPVKKAFAAAPALKPVSAIAPQSLPRPKVSNNHSSPVVTFFSNIFAFYSNRTPRAFDALFPLHQPRPA